MKRVIDKPYYAYSIYGIDKPEIYVKCPKCSGPGVVTSDQGIALFRCTSCYHTTTKELTQYKYDVENLCESCGRFYRVNITDKRKQHYPGLIVSCPFCRHKMPGKILKKTYGSIAYGDFRNAHDPFFDYELYFLAYLNGKPVWAMNREHLAYLIDYLSADLREEPHMEGTMRTQADHLPGYMKTAKNRDKVVRLLKNLQKTL